MREIITLQCGECKNRNYTTTKNRTIWVLLVLGCAVLGCAAREPVVRFSQLNAMQRPARPVEEVKVFITSKPDAEYIEMGLLTYLTYAYDPDEKFVIGKLRAKAAEVGADAIMVLETRTETYTNYATKQTYQGKVFRGMAIAFGR